MRCDVGWCGEMWCRVVVRCGVLECCNEVRGVQEYSEWNEREEEWRSSGKGNGRISRKGSSGRDSGRRGGQW